MVARAGSGASSAHLWSTKGFQAADSRAHPMCAGHFRRSLPHRVTGRLLRPRRGPLADQDDRRPRHSWMGSTWRRSGEMKPAISARVSGPDLAPCDAHVVLSRSEAAWLISAAMQSTIGCGGPRAQRGGGARRLPNPIWAFGKNAVPQGSFSRQGPSGLPLEVKRAEGAF
jgi:hypothetical protein